MVSEKIGARVQEYRKKKGLTQEKLAELLSLSPHHLSALERGKYNINSDLLVDIINLLDCTADDLFCDVVKTGYKTRASRLSDLIETLPTDEQNKIFEVVEIMVSNAKK